MYAQGPRGGSRAVGVFLWARYPCTALSTVKSYGLIRLGYSRNPFVFPCGEKGVFRLGAVSPLCEKNNWLFI